MSNEEEREYWERKEEEAKAAYYKDKQTPEEAAREHGTLYYFDKDGNRKEAGTDPKKEKAFLEGILWGYENIEAVQEGYEGKSKNGKRLPR